MMASAVLVGSGVDDNDCIRYRWIIPLDGWPVLVSGSSGCVIGLSGGVDRSWVLHLGFAKWIKTVGYAHGQLLGFRVSPVDKLKVDLFTHVIDWHE